ncbi:multiple epidermal growth factor-like domains protein 10 [Ptychodera flava]|uniref:multiple epidermal growth factor-like domains protein 10 n=1 Tax=Ptychodera flava TaxID=63121 RepID=UPI00396AA9B9
MAHTICKLTAAVFTIISLNLISSNIMAVIHGQLSPDDPNACFWYKGHDGNDVFRCCDGYFKEDITNLTEKCTECPVGRYGFSCKNNCECENGGTCNTVDGSCHCTAQYFGNSCQYPCNCQNGATCTQDGTCLCADGFYGKLCQRNCSCPETNKCDGKTGQCFCHKGFYGDLCLPCNCSKNEQCDPFNGLCSCTPGFYGGKCDKECSCFNGAYCGDDNPDHCKCSSGWVGSGCTDCDIRIVKANGISLCKEKCLHCYNGHTCSIQNVDCECVPGWQGNKCDRKCEQGFYGNNCSSICLCKSGICDHVTGICHCDSGWTGQYCDKPCPDNCVKCEGDICTSCKPGWTGVHCNSRCEPGFHGDFCQEVCPACNCSTSCHHVTGTCFDVIRCEEQGCKFPNVRTCKETPLRLECLDGWTGLLCDVTDAETAITLAKDDRNLSYEHTVSESSTRSDIESPTCMDEGFTIPTLIFVLVVAVLVLFNIAAITIACYYRKRQTLSTNRNLDYAEVGENVEMDDHRQTRKTPDYENVPRGTNINSEDYQHLSDFTYSQYQKLDISSMGGSRTYVPRV